MFGLFNDEYGDKPGEEVEPIRFSACWFLAAVCFLALLVLLYQDGRMDAIEKARKRDRDLKQYCSGVTVKPAFCIGVE